MTTRDHLRDLSSFVAVAEARSFTRAAAQLGVSQSALSHAVRGLEERLGMRLLSRTTRAVALTEAGEQLMESVGPHLAGIAGAIAALDGLRGQPAGTIRIIANEHAATTLIYPAALALMRDYPDIHVEISVDNGFTNIVEQRFDAGVRFGESLEQDMIAVPIGPPVRMAVVGSAAYFQRHPWPETPEDLLSHNCIRLRLPTNGNLLGWEFERDGKATTVQVPGQIVCNTGTVGARALRDGLGLAYTPEDLVLDEIAQGTLVRVLNDWCQPFPGYHLYYPDRRQHAPAFRLLLEALRRRG